MQTLNSDKLIKKITEYQSRQKPLIENEITDLKVKSDLIRNEFNISTSMISGYSLIQKIYSRFFTLEVKDQRGMILGIRIVKDNDDIYQLSRFNKGNIIKEEYIVKSKYLDLLVGVAKDKEQEKIYTIMPNITSLHCVDLKDLAIAEINQEIDNLLTLDNVKIYRVSK